MKKIILVLVPILLIGGFFFFKGKTSAVTAIPTNVLVEERRIESNIFLNGTVVTEEMRDVVSETNEVIEVIAVKIGDQVKKGDLLIVQNTDVLNTLLKATKLQLEIEAIKLKQLNTSKDTHLSNNLQTAKLNYSDSKSKLNKDKLLLDAGVVSKQVYDASVLVYESAKNQYENAQYSLSSSSRETDLLLQKKIVQALENDIKNVEDKIEKASLKASIEGTITDIKAIVGERASGTILTIANFSKNIIETHVSEADINKISIGQPVVITANSVKNETYSGKVTWISPDSKKVEGKKQAYVEIKVALDQVESKLRRNFSVNLKIQTANKESAKVIKFEGIKTKATGESYVTVLREDGSAEDVNIKTGIEGEVYVEVISDQVNISDQIMIDVLPAGYGEESTGLF